MTGDKERELRRAFRELRSPDSQHAPGLRAVLDRPRTERRPAIGLFAKISVAAAAIIALMFAWPRSRDVVPSTMSITEWRAPTDVLLRTPGAELVQTVPTLRSSVLEGLPLQ
jgi:hypothetical protein